MFAASSRYYPLKTLELTRADGTQVVYVSRRFCPQGVNLSLLVEASVAQSDRLDLIAARTLGKAELFWRIADANDAMDPLTLTATPGRVLRVPVPRPESTLPKL